MLDVDQEFDPSFETSPTQDAGSPAGQPASSPPAQSAASGAKPPVQSGPSASISAAKPGPAASGRVSPPANQEPSGPADPRAEDARRRAESTYQRIADEILESTKEVCQRLISDGEKALERAKFLESEAEQKRQELQKEMDGIKAVRAEAETFREKSLAAVSEAQKQAQEILDRARGDKDSQLAQIKQQAAAESQKMMAEAQAMRTAAQEELEAQKLYTEAARLKAESNEALSQLRQQMGSLLASPSRGAAQARPVPSQPQSASPRPTPLPAATTAPVPSPVATPAPAQWDGEDLDESGVPEPAPANRSARTGVDQAAPPLGPKGAPQAKPPEEDNALSRRKAGRWFGLGG